MDESQLPKIIVHRDLGKGFKHVDDNCPCEPLEYDINMTPRQIIEDVRRKQRPN